MPCTHAPQQTAVQSHIALTEDQEAFSPEEAKFLPEWWGARHWVSAIVPLCEIQLAALCTTVHWLVCHSTGQCIGGAKGYPYFLPILPYSLPGSVCTSQNFRRCNSAWPLHELSNEVQGSVLVSFIPTVGWAEVRQNLALCDLGTVYRGKLYQLYPTWIMGRLWKKYG